MERLHGEIHGADHDDVSTAELDADTMLQISKLFLRSGEDAVG